MYDSMIRSSFEYWFYLGYLDICWEEYWNEWVCYINFQVKVGELSRFWYICFILFVKCHEITFLLVISSFIFCENRFNYTRLVPINTIKHLSTCLSRWVILILEQLFFIFCVKIISLDRWIDFCYSYFTRQFPINIMENGTFIIFLV